MSAPADARAKKGAAIFAKGGVQYDEQLEAYFVASGSGMMYDVTPDRAKCSCPDFRFRRESCKHIWAAKYHAEAAAA